MGVMLGDNVFKDIELNEYLQEIFEAILYNYSIELFKLSKERRQFNVKDALRFSDLYQSRLISCILRCIRFGHKKLWHY
jgi:hypothetical protein